MSDKSDLKAELERKKQRLAQIREEKKRKEEERKKKEVRKKSESQQKREMTPEDSDLDRKRRETEALLQSIGISPEPPLVPTPVSPSKSVSTPSETGSQDSADGGAASRTLQWDTDPSVLQLQADSELGRRMLRLGASKITQVDFLPKEVVSYCKETQTPLNAHLSEASLEYNLLARSCNCGLPLRVHAISLHFSLQSVLDHLPISEILRRVGPPSHLSAKDLFDFTAWLALTHQFAVQPDLTEVPKMLAAFLCVQRESFM